MSMLIMIQAPIASSFSLLTLYHELTPNMTVNTISKKIFFWPTYWSCRKPGSSFPPRRETHPQWKPRTDGKSHHSSNKRSLYMRRQKRFWNAVIPCPPYILNQCLACSEFLLSLILLKVRVGCSQQGLGLLSTLFRFLQTSMSLWIIFATNLWCHPTTFWQSCPFSSLLPSGETYGI